MSSPHLPFRYRFCTVPGWSELFQVPQYIVRIDIDEPGKAGTHGWQVRYHKPWTLISDTRNKRRRTPQQSLDEAVRYLRSIYVGPRSRLRHSPTTRKENVLQEAGLRLVVRDRKDRNFAEAYVEAVPPTHDIPPKRVFVGTTNTVSLERLLAAVAKARVLRAAMVTEYLQTRLAHNHPR